MLDADGAATAGALKAKAARLAGGASTPMPAYTTKQTKGTTAMVAILYVLLGFSMVVSLMGMVNTMVLSVFERTRESGCCGPSA